MQSVNDNEISLLQVVGNEKLVEKSPIYLTANFLQFYKTKSKIV